MFSADMSCHWEDTDGAIQEIFSNVSDQPTYPTLPRRQRW